MSKWQQKTFDFVAKKLLKQGQVSKEHAQCVYRGPNGLKCAIGHLIPDNMYSIELEGKSLSKEFMDRENLPIKVLTRIAGTKNSKDLDSRLDFLAELQTAHDEVSFTAPYFSHNFIMNMKQVAAKYHLSTRVLKNVSR